MAVAGTTPTASFLTKIGKMPSAGRFFVFGDLMTFLHNFLQDITPSTQIHIHSHRDLNSVSSSTDNSPPAFPHEVRLWKPHLVLSCHQAHA